MINEFPNTLSDKRIRIIHDYLEASECFSGVQIKGGVSFFLWDRLYKGKCDVYSHINNTVSKMTRNLLEKGCNTFIRFNKAINILHKIHSVGEVSFSELVSSRMPFGLPNTFKGNRKKTLDTDVLVFVSGNESDVKGSVSFIPRDQIPKGDEIIDCHKVFIAKAGSGSDTFPHLILGKPFYGSPNTACNESYLVIGPFLNKKECLNVISYIASKFFRFLVLLKKGTQNAAKDDQKIISGIIHVLKFGLRWKDAPKEYGPYKTLYNRFVRWSNMGVFEKIFTALSESTQDTSLLMIDATCLKAHRTAASLRKKGFLSLYRTHKRRIEHQITCSL